MVDKEPFVTSNGDLIRLKDHFDEVLRLRDGSRVSERLADQRAIDLALANMNHKVEKLNELRGNTVSADEFKAEIRFLLAEHKGLGDRIATLEKGVVLYQSLPAVLAAVEIRTTKLEHWQAKLIGMAIASSVIVSFIMKYVLN